MKEGVFSHFADKPPPTINAVRVWKIRDDTPIGQLVGQVSTQTQDDDIVFGLEHSVGFNIFQSDNLTEPLPFDINAKTGLVYTNQSLSTWVSERGYSAAVLSPYDINLRLFALAGWPKHPHVRNGEIQRQPNHLQVPDNGENRKSAG